MEATVESMSPLPWRQAIQYKNVGQISIKRCKFCSNMTLELFRMKYKEIQQTRKLKAVMLSTTPAANYLSISDLCAVAGVDGRWICHYVIVLQICLYDTFASIILERKGIDSLN